MEGHRGILCREGHKVRVTDGLMSAQGVGRRDAFDLGHDILGPAREGCSFRLAASGRSCLARETDQGRCSGTGSVARYSTPQVAMDQSTREEASGSESSSGGCDLRVCRDGRTCGVRRSRGRHWTGSDRSTRALAVRQRAAGSCEPAAFAAVWDVPELRLPLGARHSGRARGVFGVRIAVAARAAASARRALVSCTGPLAQHVPL